VADHTMQILNSSVNPRSSSGNALFALHRDLRVMFAEVAGQREEGKTKGSAVVRPVVSTGRTAKVFLWSPEGPKDFRD